MEMGVGTNANNWWGQEGGMIVKNSTRLRYKNIEWGIKTSINNFVEGT